MEPPTVRSARLLSGKATATRANELGEWLKLQPIAGLHKPENITGANWISRVKGRTGIILFDGYWRQDGDSGNDLSGGHIDLWNRDTLTPSAESFLRFRMGMPQMRNPLSWLRGRNDNYFSDLGQSKQILFWEIK